MPEPASTPPSDVFARLTTPTGTGIVFAALALARLLAGGFSYFYEGDEISIAAGVAALMNGDAGPLYRYGPQLGYYRLIQALATVAGGPDAIPTVMVAVSALAGAVIPAAALRAFRRELPARTRVLAAAVLFSMPALWVSAQYGNAATVSTAFVVAALSLLSNAPRRGGLILALALYSAGVLVRADAVLMAPLVAVLVLRGASPWRHGVLALGAAALMGALVYATLFALDPALAGLLSQVASHFGEDNPTLFFEHLVWAVSPLVLAFAVVGLREALGRQTALAGILLVGVLPLFLFYFPTTTTTRYFLQAAFPLALLAALGITGLAALAPLRWRRPVWAALLVLAFLHLGLGLGHFEGRPFSARLKAPSFNTHDSAMYTGALVYQAYLRGGLFGRSLRGPRFGTANELATQLDARLDAVAAGNGPERALLLFHEWNGHAAVYHLLARGARLVEGDPSGSIADPLVYALGRTRVHVLWFGPATRELPERLPLVEGDEVWLLGPLDGFPDPDVRAALAPGLVLVSMSAPGSYLEVHAVKEESR